MLGFMCSTNTVRSAQGSQNMVSNVSESKNQEKDGQLGGWEDSCESFIRHLI